MRHGSFGHLRGCLRNRPLRAELTATKAELAQALAVMSASEAMISHLKLEIAKLRREQYGQPDVIERIMANEQKT